MLVIHVAARLADLDAAARVLGEPQRILMLERTSRYCPPLVRTPFLGGGSVSGGQGHGRLRWSVLIWPRKRSHSDGVNASAGPLGFLLSRTRQGSPTGATSTHVAWKTKVATTPIKASTERIAEAA